MFRYHVLCYGEIMKTKKRRTNEIILDNGIETVPVVLVHRKSGQRDMQGVEHLDSSYLTDLAIESELDVNGMGNSSDSSENTIEDVVRNIIVQAYPKGFDFSEMAIRLVKGKLQSGNWPDNDLIKDKMFQRTDGYWVFREMVADDATLQKLREQAEQWLQDFGHFAIEALAKRYELRNLNMSEDFAELLRNMGFRAPLQRLKSFCFESEGHDDHLKRGAEALSDILSDAGGILSVQELLEKMPHHTIDSANILIKRYLPDVYQVEIDGLVCWQQGEALTLPNAFAETLTKTVERLERLGIELTISGLNLALSLVYDVNFQNEYGLEDTARFENVIAKHFSGETPHKWRNHQFIQSARE